jgi:hypothetical protein
MPSARQRVVADEAGRGVSCIVDGGDLRRERRSSKRRSGLMVYALFMNFLAALYGFSNVMEFDHQRKKARNVDPSIQSECANCYSCEENRTSSRKGLELEDHASSIA